MAGKIAVFVLAALTLLAGAWAVYGFVQIFRANDIYYMPAVVYVPSAEVEVEEPPQVYQIDDLIFFLDEGQVHSRTIDGRHVATFGAADVTAFEIEIPWLIFWQYGEDAKFFYNMDTGEIHRE